MTAKKKSAYKAGSPRGQAPGRTSRQESNEVARVNNISTFMLSKRAELEAVIASNIDAGKMLHVALSVIRKSDKLQLCSRESLFQCMLEAGQFGLQIGMFNSAFMVPFGTEATLIAGYSGLIDLAIRGGNLAAIHPTLVYKGEPFKVSIPEGAGLMQIQHEPDVFGKRDNRDIIGGYCIIELTNGRTQRAFMSRGEIDLIEAKSKARTGPWKDPRS